MNEKKIMKTEKINWYHRNANEIRRNHPSISINVI